MFSYSRIAQTARPAYKFSMPLKIHIREIRTAQKLTLATVAGKAGISVPHLSEVERGEKNLNNHLMERIAVALNVRPEELVSGTDDGPDAAARAKLQKAMQAMKSADSMAKLADFAETLLLAEQASQHKQ